tara:strand:+ start:1861 stop:2583 length:723 start_codon:yes stop_codon:yes gene_type:complete
LILKGEELKKTRKKLNLTQSEFAEMVGKSARTIISWENSEEISESVVKLIHAVLKDYAMDKVSKNGRDFSKEINELADQAVREPGAVWVNYESFLLVPLVGQRAQAGFLAGYEDEEYIDELPKVPWEVDREYKGRYMTFEVSGDSMNSGDPETAILDRDLLLCREIQKIHWRNKLHINKWNFVLVHREEGILVKRIVDHNTETGELTLHSLNPFYEDYKINIKDLIAIYNAVDLRRKPIL